MKKLIFITMAIIAIFTISCDEDTETTNSLIGTTWRSDLIDDEVVGYAELNYKSSTTVDFHINTTEQILTIHGKYSISDNIITNTFTEEDDEDDTLILKGKIDGNKMILDFSEGGDDSDGDDEGGTVTFYKK